MVIYTFKTRRNIVQTDQYPICLIHISLSTCWVQIAPCAVRPTPIPFYVHFKSNPLALQSSLHTTVAYKIKSIEYRIIPDPNALIQKQNVLFKLQFAFVVDGHRCKYYSFGNLKLSLEKLSEIGDSLFGCGHVGVVLVYCFHRIWLAHCLLWNKLTLRCIIWFTCRCFLPMALSAWRNRSQSSPFLKTD